MQNRIKFHTVSIQNKYSNVTTWLFYLVIFLIGLYSHSKKSSRWTTCNASFSQESLLDLWSWMHFCHVFASDQTCISKAGERQVCSCDGKASCFCPAVLEEVTVSNTWVKVKDVVLTYFFGSLARWPRGTAPLLGFTSGNVSSAQRSLEESFTYSKVWSVKRNHFLLFLGLNLDCQRPHWFPTSRYKPRFSLRGKWIFLSDPFSKAWT